uniref:NADH dehydrogenase subunit 2 n=1 Tax=Amblyomma tholloni TaxID=1701308 RepID=UPI0022376E22|nr:NADH dehydrogenase subunit 2 [Amblyomma tholloni]UYB78002.1 NADH dehydrogenase subunit 2 [Amblyomma tholloni]
MFKNFMKWMIFMTVIITFSSNSWFIFWLMMELNLLLFVPIMNLKKMNNANCMISYFVIQSFSSTLFFISALNLNMIYMNLFELMLSISLMIKLAVIPFHFWLTNLSELIDFTSLFLILTVQKLIPLFIISTINLKLLIIFALLSSIFGSLFVFNMKMLKKILIFSSISHQGWMISLILVKSNFWISYMIIYSMLIYKITSLFSQNNCYTIIHFLKKNKVEDKMNFCMLMLSLGGMPPFFGFIMKLMSIIIIIKMGSMIIAILIVSSMLNIFIYIRMISPNVFINLLNFKISNMTYMSKNWLLNLNTMVTIFVINNMV